jgi:hypothetical protein
MRGDENDPVGPDATDITLVREYLGWLPVWAGDQLLHLGEMRVE